MAGQALPTAVQAGTPPKGVAVELERISKSFGRHAQVLREVSVQFRVGEVHGLVGQNGAGKSTLGKILGGIYRPDSGHIIAGGVSCAGWTARQALLHGVATIQQELSLVPERSVEENVFLGLESHRYGVFRRRGRDRFDRLDALCRFGLNPAAKVSDLRIADRQKVEIMRALARDANVIVMDEPASSLTSDEVDRLHAVIERLRADGRTIVYVTHSIDSILSTCDRVTVLRDARLVRTGDVRQETAAQIVTAMLGRPADVGLKRLRSDRVPDEPLVELRRLRSGRVVKDVSLTVRPGEVVGLAGLVGSGRTEVARVLAGLDPIADGEYLLASAPFRPRSVRDSIKRGVALIPEDRKREGLVLAQTVQRNVSLASPGKVSRFGVVLDRLERALAANMSARLSIRPLSTRAKVSTLSGGNQQKVLFAKWMLTAPRFLVLDEPTRGVDVGARMQIYDLIQSLVSNGTGVLLISSDLEEVMSLSNRVYLIRDGRTLGEVDPSVTSVSQVLGRLFDVGHAADTGSDRKG